MSVELPPCPKCASPFTYEDGSLLICPECAYEWTVIEQESETIRDAVGNLLKDGDSVSVIKDLKFRGGVVKVGTKAKNITLVPKDRQINDHDIDCKIAGIGAISLKSKFVKKITD